MTNIEKLKAKLQDMQIEGWSVFPSDEECSTEELAGEVLAEFERTELYFKERFERFKLVESNM